MWSIKYVRLKKIHVTIVIISSCFNCIVSFARAPIIIIFYGPHVSRKINWSKTNHYFGIVHNIFAYPKLNFSTFPSRFEIFPKCRDLNRRNFAKKLNREYKCSNVKMWVKHRCISKSLHCTFWRPLTRISTRILYFYLVRNCVHAVHKICARQNDFACPFVWWFKESMVWLPLLKRKTFWQKMCPILCLQDYAWLLIDLSSVLCHHPSYHHVTAIDSQARICRHCLSAKIE